MPITPTRPLLLGHMLQQPVNGVVGIGALVDGLGILVIREWAAHDKLAFGLEASANVGAYVDVASARELGAAAKEGALRWCRQPHMACAA